MAFDDDDPNNDMVMVVSKISLRKTTTVSMVKRGLYGSPDKDVVRIGKHYFQKPVVCTQTTSCLVQMLVCELLLAVLYFDRARTCSMIRLIDLYFLKNSPKYPTKRVCNSSPCCCGFLEGLLKHATIPLRRPWWNRRREPMLRFCLCGAAGQSKISLGFSLPHNLLEIRTRDNTDTGIF